jgi:hypothetical protein
MGVKSTRVESFFPFLTPGPLLWPLAELVNSAIELFLIDKRKVEYQGLDAYEVKFHKSRYSKAENPMILVFMSILSATVAEFIDRKTGTGY